MAVTFREIKADVLGRIMAGEWGPGDLLPGEIDLARSFGCARTTVNRALRELAEEGYLDRKRKAGTRVRLSPKREARFEIPLVRSEVESAGGTYGYRLLGREICLAPQWLGVRMGLEKGQEVLHLSCLHSFDGTAFQHEDRWINLTNLPQARSADFSRIGPNEWLVKTVPYTDVEISFSAVAAGKELAAHMGCDARNALFRIERSTWFGGSAVTFVRLSYGPGHQMTTRY